MTDEGEPSYDLLEVQYLVRIGRWSTTLEARRTMNRDELEAADLERCMDLLTSRDFHKSMPSERRPQEMLDVYRPFIKNRRVYLKFKAMPDPNEVLVLSFKWDTSR